MKAEKNIKIKISWFFFAQISFMWFNKQYETKREEWDFRLWIFLWAFRNVYIKVCEMEEINTYICRTWNQNFSWTIYNIFLFISDLLTVLRFYLKSHREMWDFILIFGWDEKYYKKYLKIFNHFAWWVEFLPRWMCAPIKLL